tara:strand:+ start:382 stop:525 length:144 start_codon:yes stop_codon:yes gene_type:complete
MLAAKRLVSSIELPCEILDSTSPLGCVAEGAGVAVLDAVICAFVFGI